MPCDPYKSSRCTEEAESASVRDLRTCLRFVLVVITCLTGSEEATAQWWGAPVDCYPPCGDCPRQVIVLQRPTVQLDPIPAGAERPPLLLPAPDPAITNFPPATQPVLPSAPTPAQLDRIDGGLRVILTENLLNRLLTRNDVNAGPIHDVILDAAVTGEQTTESRVTVDVQPSNRTARIAVELNGTTFNQTVGVTQQAAVRSRGTHEFRMTKQVEFDGIRFMTRSPAAWVTPRLTNEGALTPMSGVPLIGPLATRIALTTAERRRPVTEQIVSQRVTTEVAPRFNTEVDQLLGRANDQLRSAIPRLLTTAGFARSDQRLSSTTDAVLFGVRLPGTGISVHRPPASSPSGASAQKRDGDDGWITIRQISHRVSSETRPVRPPPQVAGGSATTVAVHEEFVNHLLGRASLEGRQVPDRTIDRVLAILDDVLSGESLSRVFSEPFGTDEPEYATILLADERPLSVRFEAGQVLIVAHAGFRPVLTPEVPTQRVEIPFTLQANEGRFSLVPGEVRVESRPGEAAGPMVEIARPVIRQQVESRLHPVPLPSTVPLRFTGLSETSLTLRAVTVADGWLIVAVD